MRKRSLLPLSRVPEGSAPPKKRYVEDPLITTGIVMLLRTWEEKMALNNPECIYVYEAGMAARHLVDLLKGQMLGLSLRNAQAMITNAVEAGAIIRIGGGPTTAYVTPSRVGETEDALRERSIRLRALGVRAEKLGLAILYYPTFNSPVTTSIELGMDVGELVELLERA